MICDYLHGYHGEPVSVSTIRTDTIKKPLWADAKTVIHFQTGKGKSQ